MSSALIEYLVLVGIALFIGWRLFTTLGQDEGPPEGKTRTGDPVQPQAGRSENSAAEVADILSMRPNFTGPGADGLEAIHARDESFDPTSFLRGARAAYKMIVEAYARDDLVTLKPLLDTDVYDTWSAAIEARKVSGAQAPSLLKLRDAEIVDASLDENDIARIFVEYKSELGDGETSFQAHEIWTFMRQVTSRDPNWILDDVDTVQA